VLLQVQDKATLEEALELFVAGEQLAGDNKYRCDKCGDYVTAQRRCTIKELPRTLIVHLKRFEFDVETMTRRKLNHRLAFPTLLDMAPYTSDGVAQREHRLLMRAESSLGGLSALPTPRHSVGEPRSPERGGGGGGGGGRSSSWRESSARLSSQGARAADGSQVVAPGNGVATGCDEGASSAEATSAGAAAESDPAGGARRSRLSSLGSFGLRSRDAAMPPCEYALTGVVAHTGTTDSGHYYSFIRVEDGRWMEFNDRVVTPFDPADLPRECFGGPQEAGGNGRVGGGAGGVRVNNAYLL
ncbi:unnamed protein product, partial [Phaeothamnion confervicola]